MHLVRHLGEVHRRLQQGRTAPIDTPRSLGTVHAHDLDRLAAGAGELRLRLCQRQDGRLPVLDLRRHRHRLLLRARQSDRPGLARRDPGARPRPRGRGVRRRRQAGARREGRAGLHHAVPLDAGRLLERPRRREISRRLFRALPRRLVPRRLRRDHRAWRHDHLRPLGRACSIPAACASARRRSTARSSSSPRWSRASSSARTGTATCASCCSCGCATGSRSTRR